MSLDRHECYAALRARDPRFDGRFFTAVRTTGVFCRPVCPARPPKLENVTFFGYAAAAEAAGYRPCKKCRPDSAPGSREWIGTPSVVSRALRLINGGALDNDRGVDELAKTVGVAARHLRRLFDEHVGASPTEIARARRAHVARQLIDGSELTMSEIAFASGYRSVRQFNHHMRQVFHEAPSALRTKRTTGNAPIQLRLSARPPVNWDSIFDFFGAREIPGVESVDGHCYRRTMRAGDSVGVIQLEQRDDALLLTIDLDGTADVLSLVARARRTFDLDADPDAVERSLHRDPIIGPLLQKRPGIRVPGAWDPFETAVRAVLGQQVSVAAATTLAGHIAAQWGQPIATSHPELSLVFPRAEDLSEADLTEVGVTRQRSATIRRLANAVGDGSVELNRPASLSALTDQLMTITGIGEWTAGYIAMRLGEPDGYPHNDLILNRLGGGPEQADAWRPWRAYAARLLWASHSDAKHLTQLESA